MNFFQFIFGSLCLFGYYAAIEAYRIGVGRADCTGPPVEVVFVSVFSCYLIHFVFLRFVLLFSV